MTSHRVIPFPTRHTGSENLVMPLPLHVDDYELWQAARRLSPVTTSERRRVLIAFHRDTGVQPAHAKAIDIVRWYADHPHWSASTHATYHAYLNSWFTWLQSQDVRADNPMVKIGAPKAPERLPRPVSDADVRALITTSTHQRTRAMVMLAAFQGLRVHEIAKNSGESIDLDQGTLTVKGKGGSLHSLPLHPRVAELSYLMPRRGWWFPATSDRPGDHMRAKSVSRTISNAMERCGIRATPHALRHYFASRLLADGADIYTVRDLLRHKNIQTTVIYAKLPTSTRTAAVSRIDPWQPADTLSSAA